MLPRFVEARQSLPAPAEPDVPSAARAAARALAAGLRPGASVAITAGSRGITRIAEITGNVVAELAQAGMRPFIVPAMGSHGGGTADGQVELLAGYGITEQSMNAPVRAAMEVELLGETQVGVPAHFDRIAMAADAVIALNPDIANAAATAVKGASSEAKLATFDLNPDVTKRIKDDSIAFAIDQQQYLQGYLPIVFLTLNKTNANTVGGGQPVLTGPGFVTKDNAETVAQLAKDGTR